MHSWQRSIHTIFHHPFRTFASINRQWSSSAHCRLALICVTDSVVNDVNSRLTVNMNCLKKFYFFPSESVRKIMSNLKCGISLLYTLHCSLSKLCKVYLMRNTNYYVPLCNFLHFIPLRPCYCPQYYSQTPLNCNFLPRDRPSWIARVKEHKTYKYSYIQIMVVKVQNRVVGRWLPTFRGSLLPPYHEYRGCSFLPDYMASYSRNFTAVSDWNLKYR